MSQHPIFTLENDEVFSLILNQLNDIFKKQKNPKNCVDLTKWLENKIFDAKPLSKLEEEFKALGLIRGTLCGKVIGKGETIYWCLDCEFPGQTNVIDLFCLDCFQNSNHEDHRVVMIRCEGATLFTCNCGDESYVKAENCCLDHRPHHVDINQLLSKFPPLILEKCHEVLPKFFYAIVALFEISKAMTDSYLKLNILDLAQKVSEEVLNFCLMCQTKLNQAFLPVLDIIFRDHFKSPDDLVWHKCDDLKGEDLENFGKHAQACKCTIFGNILRLASTFRRDQQNILHKIVFEYSKVPSYQEFAYIEFSKNLFFFYSQDYAYNDPEDNINSTLLKILPHFAMSEDLRMKMLDSGYFPNLQEVMRHAVYNFAKISFGLYHVLANTHGHLCYFLDSATHFTERVMTQTEIFREAISLLSVFQTKVVYGRDQLMSPFSQGFEQMLQQVTLGFIIEKCLCFSLETAVESICKFPQPTKELLMKKLLGQWYDDYQTTCSIMNKEYINNHIFLHSGLERIFSFTIAKYFQNSCTIQGIQELLKETIPHAEPNKIAQDILTNILRTIGIMNYLRNMNVNTVYHVLNAVCLFFEADVVSVQMMSLISDPDQLFETLTANFFFYNKEIQGYLRGLEPMTQDNTFKLKVNAIQDFLRFLIYIMNDELCVFNLISNNSEASSPKRDPNFDNAVEKILLNLLLGSYWTPYPMLKEFMKGYFREEQEFNDIIAKIAIVDQKAHTVRIKEEYYSEFDPYILYRQPHAQHEISNSFSSKVKKNQQIDLVSGKYYTELPAYLKSIQRNIYKSKLPVFLSLFITKLPEETLSLIQPILKLVLFNLEVANEARNTKDDSSKGLMDQIQANYLKSDFSATLDKIAQKKGLEDCRLCIEKIQALLVRLSSDDYHQISSPTKNNNQKEENQENTKEKLAKERMEKLKEEFVKKQALFATKNVEAQNNGIDLKAKDNEERITCQRCLEQINKEKELYGTPVFITFTNNMYDPDKKDVFPEKDHTNRWWTVVSSCNHYYHKKCFEAVNKVSKTTRDAQSLFTNPYETYCSLCKVICNYFICVNSEEVYNSPENGQIETFEIYRPLSNTLTAFVPVYLVKYLSKAYRDEGAFVLTVFEKAFHYFLDGFHLNSEPKSLEKFCLLYQNFFKEIGVDLIRNIKSRLYKAKFILLFEFTKQPGAKVNLEEYDVEAIVNEFCFMILESAIVFVTRKTLTKTKNHLISKVIQSITDPEAYKVSNTKKNNNKDLDQTNKSRIDSIIKRPSLPIDKAVLACWINRTETRIEGIGRPKSQTVNQKSEKSEMTEAEILTNYVLILEDYILYKIGEVTTIPSLMEGNKVEFVKDLVKHLGFPIRKITMASLMTRNIIFGKQAQGFSEDVLSLLCKTGDISLDDIESLLKIIDPSLTLDNLINKILSDIEKRPKLQLNFLDVVFQMESKKAKDGVVKFQTTNALVPRMIELPKNYAEFVNKYFKAKCQLCNKVNNKMNTVICLICGTTLGSVQCGNVHGTFGNLNLHAQDHHLGLGIFVGIQFLEIIILGNLFNSGVSNQHVYMDQFGQSAQFVVDDMRNNLGEGKSVNFKNFVLNEEFIEYAKNLIYHHETGKEAFRWHLSIENQRIPPGAF